MGLVHWPTVGCMPEKGYAAIKNLFQAILVVMVVSQQAVHILAEEVHRAVVVVATHGQMWSQRHLLAFG